MLPSWVAAAADAAAPAGGRRHAVAIGGRSSTTSWVVFTGAIGVFLKTAPLDDAGDLREEHAALTAAAAAIDGVPVPFGLHEVEGRLVLAQEVLPGRSLATLLRSRRRAGKRAGLTDIRGVAAWAARLAASDAVPDDGAPPVRLGAALRERAGDLAAHPAFDRLAATLDDAPPEQPVPVHGDLWPGNILVDRGRIGVVDWQHAHRGRALHDLLFFLFTYAHTRPDRSWTWRAAEDAFAAAFLEPGWLSTAAAAAVRDELRRRGSDPASAEARLLLFALDQGAHVGPAVGPPADWSALSRAVLDDAGSSALA